LREESLLVFCFQSGGILRFAQNDNRSTISATCLAAGSSTEEFSHRLESSTLSGCTVRFRKPRRRPWLESGGAFNAGIKVGQIRIHESCWLAIYARWLLVAQLAPRSMHKHPPQTPLCLLQLNFRLRGNSPSKDCRDDLQKLLHGTHNPQSL